MARALLASKRAEIEAADLLEKPKNPKDADPAAADLLKVGPWHPALQQAHHSVHTFSLKSIEHVSADPLTSWA